MAHMEVGGSVTSCQGGRMAGASPGCSNSCQSTLPCGTPDPELEAGACVGGIQHLWLAEEWTNQPQNSDPHLEVEISIPLPQKDSRYLDLGLWWFDMTCHSYKTQV